MKRYYDYFYGTRRPYTREPEHLAWDPQRLSLDVELLAIQEEAPRCSREVAMQVSYAWLPSLVSAAETINPYFGLPPFWRTPSKRRNR